MLPDLNGYYPFSYQYDNLSIYKDPFRQIFHYLSPLDKAKLLQLDKKVHAFFLAFDYEKTVQLHFFLDHAIKFCHTHPIIYHIQPGEPPANAIALAAEPILLTVHTSLSKLSILKKINKKLSHFFSPHTKPALQAEKPTQPLGTAVDTQKTDKGLITLENTKKLLVPGKSFIENENIRFRVISQLEDFFFSLNLKTRHCFYKAHAYMAPELVKDAIFPYFVISDKNLKQLLEAFLSIFRDNFEKHTSLILSLLDKIIDLPKNDEVYYEILDTLINFFILHIEDCYYPLSPKVVLQIIEERMLKYAYENPLLFQESYRLFYEEMYSLIYNAPRSNSLQKRILNVHSEIYSVYCIQWCFQEFKTHFTQLIAMCPKLDPLRLICLTDTFCSFVNRQLINIIQTTKNDTGYSMNILNSLISYLYKLCEKIPADSYTNYGRLIREFEHIRKKVHLIILEHINLTYALAMLENVATNRHYENRASFLHILMHGSEEQLQLGIELLKLDSLVLNESLTKAYSDLRYERLKPYFSSELLAYACSSQLFCMQIYGMQHVDFIQKQCLNNNPEFGGDFIQLLLKMGIPSTTMEEWGRRIATPIAMAYAKKGNFAKADEICFLAPSIKDLIQASIQKLRESAALIE